MILRRRNTAISSVTSAAPPTSSSAALELFTRVSALIGTFPPSGTFQTSELAEPGNEAVEELLVAPRTNAPGRRAARVKVNAVAGDDPAVDSSGPGWTPMLLPVECSNPLSPKQFKPHDRST
jgi:hypothetical protein